MPNALLAFMPGFDGAYLLYVAPALLLAMWAQNRVRSTFRQAAQMPARLNGAQAARMLLDAEGLQSVHVEPVAGNLTDHYDPRGKVLRLSEHVYAAPSLAAVGIAAHEAGHALQDAKGYALMGLRNAAIPLARFGGAGLMAAIAGMMFQMTWLIYAGLILFGGTVVFQLFNLIVEFDASKRAKIMLVERGIVSPGEMGPVNRVLSAAAWTYVAGTLQSILVLLYYASFFLRGSRSR